jgi:hypothetical protein
MCVSALGLRIRVRRFDSCRGHHQPSSSVAGRRLPGNKSERPGIPSAVMITAWSMSLPAEVDHPPRPSSKPCSTRPGSPSPRAPERSCPARRSSWASLERIRGARRPPDLPAEGASREDVRPHDGGHRAPRLGRMDGNRCRGPLRALDERRSDLEPGDQHERHPDRAPVLPLTRHRRAERACRLVRQPPQLAPRRRHRRPRRLLQPLHQCGRELRGGRSDHRQSSTPTR